MSGERINAQGLTNDWRGRPAVKGMKGPTILEEGTSLLCTIPKVRQNRNTDTTKLERRERFVCYTMKLPDFTGSPFIRFKHVVDFSLRDAGILDDYVRSEQSRKNDPGE